MIMLKSHELHKASVIMQLRNSGNNVGYTCISRKVTFCYEILKIQNDDLHVFIFINEIKDFRKLAFFTRGIQVAC